MRQSRLSGFMQTLTIDADSQPPELFAWNGTRATFRRDPVPDGRLASCPLLVRHKTLCPAGFEVSLVRVGDAQPSDEPPWSRNMKAESDSSVRPCLCSLLQKAVRRKVLETARSAAHELARIDPVALLRRISIIMVEDVIATRHVTGCVWLMMAATNDIDTLTSKDIEWICDVVVPSMCIDDRIDPSSSSAAEQLQEHPSLRKAVLAANMSRADGSRTENHIPLSLITRAAYGGMDGDRAMLVRSAMLHSEIPETVPVEVTTPPLSPRPRSLTEESWIIEAIDFHCVPSMLRTLSRKMMDLDEDATKKLVWNHSSRPNARKPETTHLDPTPMWQALRPILVDFQRNFLRRMYSRRRSVPMAPMSWQ